MYTIRHTLLGNIRTFFMSDVLAAKPAQATEMSVADLKALFDFTPTSGELILPYPSEANKTTLTKADFDKIKALVTADNAKDAIRELSLIKKASTPANELSVVLAEVQKAAAPEVQKAKVSNDIEKTAIKDTATIARDTVHTSAADVAQTRSRYENRLNFNDIMDIFQKNPDFFKNISKNDMYISTDTETKQVVQTPLMVGLTKLGYISREQYMNNSGNNYTTKELSAIVSLRDEILGNPGLMKSLSAEQYERTQKIEKYDPTDVKNLLAHMSDLSGEGMLTSMNTKNFSKNPVWAAFQRVLGTADDAQLHIEGELSMYRFLTEKIKTIPELVALLVERTGKTEAYITGAMKSKEGFKEIIAIFQRGHLTDAALSTRAIAGQLDKSLVGKFGQEKAREDVANIEKIEVALKAGGLSTKIEAALKEAGINPTADTVAGVLNATALRIHSFDPHAYIALGVSGTVANMTTHLTTNTTTNTTNTHTIYDTKGNAIKQSQSTTSKQDTKTETTHESKKSIGATLFIGFGQELVKYATEKSSASVSVGAGLSASAAGIAIPIGITGAADVTLRNTNAPLQTRELAGNWLAGAHLSLGVDASTGKFGPSVGGTINIKDMKNAIEKQEIRLTEMFQKITIDKTTGNNNTTALLNTLNEIETGAKDEIDPTKKKNLLIETMIMRLALIQINADINTPATPELTPTEKKQMLGNSLVAIRTTYMAEVYKAQKGFHVAGATFALYITGVFAGINIQHVRQHANIVQDTQADRIEAKILRREPVAATTAGLAPYGSTLSDDKAGIITKLAPGQGQAIVAAGHTNNVNIVESTDKLTKTITPKAGYKITIETAIYTTDTGTQSRALIISTLPVAADTSTPVPDTVTAGFAPVDGVQPTGQPTQVYTAESAAAAQKQANTTRDTIHDLAHHNTDMISAMNLVIARKYTEAGQVLAKSKIVGSLWPQAVATMDTGGQAKYLIHLLLATSGGKDQRKLSIADMTTFNAVSKNQEGASRKALLESLPAGTSKDDMAAVQKAHIAIADGLKMKNTEAAQNTVLASALMPGSTDVSGTVTFTQVTDGKATVRGIAGFHGDFSVLSKTMPITDVTMQRQIVASGVETGAVAENMARANEFIREQYTKPSTLPSGTVAPQFDMGTYQTYLLTGALPSTFGIIISTATRANYRAARAALSGATCWNDVHLLGYPQLAILIPGQKASRQPNNPIITPADKAIQQGHSAAGNKLANNGGVGEVTLGRIYQSIITNAISHIVQDKVVNTNTNTSVTQVVGSEPVNPTPVTPPGNPVTPPGQGD